VRCGATIADAGDPNGAGASELWIDDASVFSSGALFAKELVG
jgi:hypothetical protein